MVMGLFHGYSYKQGVVAFCSTESEFIAPAEAFRELLWLEKLLKNLGIEMPIQMMEDNQICIPGGKMNACTKHISLRYYLVCDLTEKGIIEMIYCHTREMTADITPSLFKRLLPERV